MALTNVTFVKAVNNGASQEFKDRIGEVTATNMSKIADIISTYPSAKNEFISVLTNQVSKQLFFNKVYQNPYKLFHRGMLPYGKSIESIFVDIIKGKDRVRQTDGTELATSLLSRETPNVKVEYYSENIQRQYQATLTDEELKGAFRTENGLSQMTSRLLESPLSSAEYDQFLMVKSALAHLKGATVTIGSGASTDELKAKALTKALKSQILKLGFLSNKYNGQGVMTYTKPQDLVLLVNADVMANLDVEMLATAFHIDKVEVTSHILPIDDFVKYDAEALEDGNKYPVDDKLCAVLMDKDAIQIYDTLNSTEQFRNPQALYTNIWYNKWGILSACNFANCVKFTLE